MERGQLATQTHDHGRRFVAFVFCSNPAIERALSELYRVLAPGGRLLVTTDCSPESKPFAENVRYFTESELEKLFAPYPVTSVRTRPDFAEENWCYGGKLPVVTSFVRITKP